MLFRCSQYLGPAISLLLATTAFLSPILMVALPQVCHHHDHHDHHHPIIVMIAVIIVIVLIMMILYNNHDTIIVDTFPCVQLGVFGLRLKDLQCDVTCDGMLISFAFKLLILLIGSWAVFFRRYHVFFFFFLSILRGSLI